MAREYEHIQNCRSCGAEVVFLRTRKGKLMPCDAATVEHDDYQFEYGKHTSHFDTCLDPSPFKKEKS